MTLGHPQALWLLSLVPVIIALYLRRRRTTRIVVPSLLFWQDQGRAADGPPFSLTLRKLLSLLAQVAFLCLLVSALADPRYPAASHSQVVVIVDVSATMLTRRPDGKTRMQLACDRARQRLAAVPNDTTVTLIQAGDHPRVLVRATRSKPEALAALLRLQSVDMDSDLHEAVHLACSLRSTTEPLQIVCISDFVAVDDAPQVNDGIDLVIEQVGVDEPNVGVVSLAFQQDLPGLDVQLGQHGLTDRPVVVTANSAGREVARAGARLNEGPTNVRLPLSLLPGTIFCIQVDPVDVLPLDNQAWAVWPDSKQLRVQLAANWDRYLRPALLSGPVELRTSSLQKWKLDPQADICVLVGQMPPADATGRFIVFAGDAVGSTSRPTGRLTATFWATNHPVLANVDPSLWSIRNVADDRVPAEARVLAAAGAVPLIYEINRLAGPRRDGSGGMKAIIVNFALGDSDLPLRPAFPVLLWDTIAYLCPDWSPSVTVALPTGSVLRWPSSQMNEPATVTVPREQPLPMLKQSRQWVWLRTSRQGVYHVEDAEHKTDLALNWFSRRSAVPFKPLMANERDSTAPTRTRLGVLMPLWEMLLAVGVGLSLVEWFLFQRRILDMRQE